jgi:single-strand DNA-binding protein
VGQGTDKDALRCCRASTSRTDPEPELARSRRLEKLAEICGEYLTKGKLVYIEGSIRSRQWEDKSGNKRTSYEILARNMQVLGSRSDAERAAAAGSRPAASQGATSEERYDAGPEPSPEGEITDDDIPF